MKTKAEIAHRFAQNLVNIFATDADAQDRRNFWVLEEGYQRSPYLRDQFNITTAKKDRKCERGCKIEAGQRYFRTAGLSGTNRICAPCMAMILYYQDIWQLPVYEYDYWDEKSNAPHFDPRSDYALGVRHTVDTISSMLSKWQEEDD